MLFDATHFEQIFSEQALKKGLRLFEQGKTSLHQRHSVALEFEVAGAGLTLRKKADRVLGYTCDCGNRLPCEHLAAALFLLQQDRLSLAHAQKPRKKRDRAPKKQLPAFSHYLQKFRKLLREQTTPDGSGEKLAAAPHHGLLAAEAHTLAHTGGQVLADLVVASVLSPLFAMPSHMPKTLRDLFRQAESRLKNLRPLSLPAADKAAWLLAATQSLRSGQMLHSGLYSWLVPGALPLTRDASLVNDLLALAEKRRIQKAFHEGYNPLQVLRCMIALRLKELKQGEVPGRLRKCEPEFSIARAEYDVLKGRSAKALAMLEPALRNLAQEPGFAELLNYALALANRLKVRDKELAFIKTGLVMLPILHRDQLRRFFEIGARADVEEITAVLRQSKGAAAGEKLKEFLMASQQYKELFGLLRNEKDGFQQLHELALCQLPEPGEDLLRVYCIQLERAFSYASYESQKEKLIGKLMTLMKGLSAADHKKLIARLPAEILYMVKEQPGIAMSSILQ